jgi:uncharacterized membrane protein
MHMLNTTLRTTWRAVLRSSARLRHLTVSVMLLIISVVKINGAEYQTGNKPAYVDQAIVEWNERILL